MSWFKRLCLFVFGLAGLVAVAILALSWVGPWTAQVRSWLERPWFFLVLEVLVCLLAVGLLACVLVSLFAPRNPKETVVAEVEGGKITVTRHAIVSQVRHVIEADGRFKASSIHVRVRKRGNVRVSVRIMPTHPVDVIAEGERMYAVLGEGLAKICGDSVKSINVVFTHPSQMDDADEDESASTAASASSQDGAEGVISVRPHVRASYVRPTESTTEGTDEASSRELGQPDEVRPEPSVAHDASTDGADANSPADTDAQPATELDDAPQGEDLPAPADEGGVASDEGDDAPMGEV